MMTRLRWWAVGSGALVLLAGGMAMAGGVRRDNARWASAQGPEGTAVLVNVAGETVGSAVFTQQDGRVLVQIDVRSLPSGFHGFHVHAVGTCDASSGFASAGGHMNPHGMTHADHAGDQPSLLVNADGSGTLSFTTDRYSMADLFDEDGSALIIHANPDNFGNIPARYAAAPDEMTLATGDAGGRLACGVVTP
jgi:superoxide dismutase, Cu-Zn family